MFQNETRILKKKTARRNCQVQFHPLASLGTITTDEEQQVILEHIQENNIEGEYWLEFEKLNGSEQLIGIDSRSYEYSNLVLENESFEEDEKFVSMSSDEDFKKWRIKGLEDKCLPFCEVDLSLRELFSIPIREFYSPIDPDEYSTATSEESGDQCEVSKVSNTLAVDHSRHIFQIGFNKCGTTSLYYFFKNNNVSSCHWDGGKLGATMYRNYKDNNLLLEKTCGTASGPEFLCNMEFSPAYHPLRLYKILDKQYPNSRFILNVRKKENWLTSKTNERGGLIIPIIAKYHNITEEEVLESLNVLWDEHVRNVTKYFEGREDNKLLVFDIEKDSPEKLVEFFKDWYPLLDARLWKHRNNTKYKRMIRGRKYDSENEMKIDNDVNDTLAHTPEN